MLRADGKEERRERAIGLRASFEDDERVPSFVLGVAGVSPLELADAYATFAAR